MRRLGLSLLFLFALVHTAAADVCVVLDESRDTLSPDDRRAAAISFSAALDKAGVQVANTNCTTTYTFYNVKLGDTITVYAVGPTGARQARATKIDELPMVYEQLTHAMVTNTQMGDVGNVDRTNATTDQMAPRRVSADGLKYVRLGYGAVTGKTTLGGTAFGAGYRYELDQLAVDVSFNLVWATQEVMDPSGGRSTKGGVNGEWIRLGAVKYLDPLANNTMYFGGGLGYGTNTFYDDSNGANYSGSGLEATGIVGYETLRASTIRLFVEANVTLPMYTSSYSFGTGAGSTNRWGPVISLTVGAGLGHSNTVTVVNR